MDSNGFQACCGINIVTGFPYDEDGDYAEQELASIVPEIENYEGTYCHCHLVALNNRQTRAAEEILKAGYTLVGDFQSSHGGGARVNLYAKGVDFAFPVIEKVIAKPKRPKTRKVGRVKLGRKK